MPTQGRPETIAFIGAGNMANAIIGGLIGSGYSPSHIRAADPSARAREALKALNVQQVFEDPCAAVTGADMVVLAVKPQVMAAALEGVKDCLPPQCLVMSIAAGISASSLDRMLGGRQWAIVRCMPNTPSLVYRGASGLFANKHVSEQQRQFAEATMASVGTTLWLEQEDKLDAVTAVSGSGPAYFFAFMEAMIDSGERLGLSRQVATELTLQTALGAAHLAAEQPVSIDTLRANVTSPGGTTERALQAFEREQLGATVDAAMQACYDRAQAMATEFD